MHASWGSLTGCEFASIAKKSSWQFAGEVIDMTEVCTGCTGKNRVYGSQTSYHSQILSIGIDIDIVL